MSQRETSIFKVSSETNVFQTFGKGAVTLYMNYLLLRLTVDVGLTPLRHERGLNPRPPGHKSNAATTEPQQPVLPAGKISW